MPMKTYHGSCHCGRVRFEADIDLAAGTNRCNCSICTKQRNWNAILKPDAFRLLAGVDDLGDYRFTPDSLIHHHFCRTCGITLFSQGYVAEIGGAYVGVKLATLDDATPEELADAPVAYCNGRDNDWTSPPAETRHL